MPNHYLRLPHRNDAKIAKICILWTFCLVIQLINHLFKIQKKVFCQILKIWSICWITGKNVQRLLFWLHSYEVTLTWYFWCIFHGSNSDVLLYFQTPSHIYIGVCRVHRKSFSLNIIPCIQGCMQCAECTGIRYLVQSFSLNIIPYIQGCMQYAECTGIRYLVQPTFPEHRPLYTGMHTVYGVHRH